MKSISTNKYQKPRLRKKPTPEEVLGTSKDHKDPTQIEGIYKLKFLEYYSS